jgi:precorrin-3B C17-methyltransferase
MRSISTSDSQGRGTDSSETVDQKRDNSHRPNQLFVVGIGPGSPEHLTRRAAHVLASVEVVAGYSTYIDLIRPLIEGKEIISTGMTKEVARVEGAIEQAQAGKSCAIVSSGDPGIYAMAGLVFETCKIKGIEILPPDSDPRAADDSNILRLEVVPGIPALCAGAALLGAPLTHDFAAISLSDLLTPWELIEQRLEAAARSDFVIVLYNPKSKKRNWQLGKARQIILRHRDKNTPVGIVSRAMREEQNTEIVTLDNMHTAEVDMQTTVFIGSSTSSEYMDFMYTPRGYAKKYEIQK